jgi:hypothetical protein
MTLGIEDIDLWIVMAPTGRDDGGFRHCDPHESEGKQPSS